MDQYELHKATLPFIQFIDQLTNWYIRRSRSRFWSEHASQDRNEAFFTLYTTLMTLCKVAAPFIPFITETIYQELRTEANPISIHLTDFPMVNESLRNKSLEEEMSVIQSVVSLGHGLRKEHKIKVRQPLGKAYVATTNKEALSTLESKKHLILEELNVKDLICLEDETRFVQLIAKPNFRVLGKKVGNKMNLVQKKIAELDRNSLQILLEGKSIDLNLGDETISILPEEITLERKTLEGTVAASLGIMTIALDTALTPALIEEGIARELVNRINTLRKDLDFSITDRIRIEMQAPSSIQESFLRHKEYICHEVLAVDVLFNETSKGSAVEVAGESLQIAISIA